MQSIKSKDTSIEIILRKRLWSKGIRYRKNFKDLPGKPDIAITKHKIAIFCDSEFFHGRDWDKKKEKLKLSPKGDYWITKIEKNITRDHETNKALESLGWTVIRFWGNDIKRNTDNCVCAIQEAIFDKMIEEYQD